jgi:hypothetical protein
MFIDRVFYSALVFSSGLGVVSFLPGAPANLRPWVVFLLASLFLYTIRISALAKIRDPYLLLILAIYFGATCFSVVNAIDNNLFVRRIILISSLMALCWYMSQRSAYRNLYLAHNVIIWSGSVFALLAILELYIFEYQRDLYALLHILDVNAYKGEKVLGGYGSLVRARGYFEEANEFSQFLLLPTGYVIAKVYFGLRENGLGIGRYYWAAGLLLMVAQTASLSRGGFLGIAGELLALVFLANVIKAEGGLRNTIPVGKLARGLIVAGLLFLSLHYTFDIMFNITILDWVEQVTRRLTTTGSASDLTTDIRFKSVSLGLAAISSDVLSFIFGVGAGNMKLSVVGEPTTSNQFIDVLVENGVIGILSYLLFIIYLLWKSYAFMRRASWANNKHTIIVFAGFYLSFIGMVVGGFTYSTHSLFFFWLNAGLLSAVTSTKFNYRNMTTYKKIHMQVNSPKLITL